jgi:glycerol-3-phosphate dehydrogenase
LARRIRLLFLDAKAAMEAAPAVAQMLASILERDEPWEWQQVENFNTLAKGYLLT